jgi:hypothetical protein
MNTVTRIENTFTDRFIADCARCIFGTTADDYSDECSQYTWSKLEGKNYE